MTAREWAELAAALIGTLGFGILFNLRGKRLITAAVGGFLSWLLLLLLHRAIPSEPLGYFLVSFAISIGAEIAARLHKTPKTAFLTTCLIPLIPGGSLYYTMSAALEQDGIHFATRALDTLKLAAALALGIIAATMLTDILLQMIVRWKERKKENGGNGRA